MNYTTYIILIAILLIPKSELPIEVFSTIPHSSKINLSYETFSLNKEQNDYKNYYLALAKNTKIPYEQRLDLLIHLLDKSYRKEQLKLEYDLNFTCYRYKKGIEILKMVYEKILALDHHFSSLRTFRDIHELSNPNSYPEFIQAKQNFKNSTKKKSTVKLPDILDNNPFVSVGYTLISSVFGDGNKNERAREIEEISCLLDFTISMHSDLKIIYYETDYLRMSNKELMLKCRLLFEDYTRAIAYKKTLDECRNSDDWDNLFLSLEERMKSLNQGIRNGLDNNMNTQIKNIEFSVDRLIMFIENYDDFIYQGEQYYHKFKTIINSYENKTECVDNLPGEFSQLEKEISYSIEKFKTAYNMAELQGSKLRDLIYGNPEDL